MFCPKCQKENLEGSQNCAFCGEPMMAQNVQPIDQLNIQPPVPTPSVNPIHPSNNSKTIAIIAGGFVLVVVLAIIGYFLFIKKPLEEDNSSKKINSGIEKQTIERMPAPEKQTVERMPAPEKQTIERAPAPEKQTIERAPAPEVQTIENAPIP